MDRAEAIKILEGFRYYIIHEDTNEALDLAIEALKGDLHCPKCGTIVRDGRQYHDLVYRGEAEKLQLFGETSTNSNKNSKDNLSFSKKENDEGDAESATTTDCISRADTIKAICAECWWKSVCGGDCIEVAAVKGIPPVTPTERTGEWVSHELWDMPWFTCSECNYHGRSDFKFCPNCGCAMIK